MKKPLIVAAALLALAALVYAGNNVETYGGFGFTAPSEQISGATVADSTTATTIIASRAQDLTDGAPTVAASVDFSGAAGDTCVVSCLLFNANSAGTLTFIGLSTATATAGAYVDAAADNIAPLVFFDTAGASHYEIRHAAPSAGNVDLKWWRIGPSPE